MSSVASTYEEARNTGDATDNILPCHSTQLGNMFPTCCRIWGQFSPRWSPHYFSRLWCCYEIATFLREEQKPVTLFPVAFSWIAVIWVIVFVLPMAIIGLAKLKLDCSNCGDSGEALILLLVADSALNAMMVYVGLDLFSAVDGLDCQLEEFSIEKSHCFCCSHGHQHPDTGEPLICDRTLVFQAVRQWYGDGANEKFNQTVRSSLRGKVLESFSLAALPKRLVFYLPCLIMLPLLSDCVARIREGILWMPNGPMHSFWRAIAIISGLYTARVLVTMSLLGIFWMTVRLASKLTAPKICLSAILGLLLMLLICGAHQPLDEVLMQMEAADLVDFVPFINFLLLLLNWCLYKETP